MRQRRRHLTLPVALIAVAGTTFGTMLTASVLVTWTDPVKFSGIEEALWWAASTVTTVGYGDVVPASSAGRLVGTALMFVGIACLALLTAIAASAIVVGRVRPEEQEIERAERQIELDEVEILARLDDVAQRLDRLERDLHDRTSRQFGAHPSTEESREGVA
jgi:voltage-gated potassium channel Kch